jgi:1,4-dihydroxy-6-naphthoate synthase
MKLSLGFSPCPNDTFIFDALVNRKIDTGSFSFDIFLEDVETLNEWAHDGRLDITKLSFPALFRNLDKYVLLNAGSALGKGVGPLLVSKRPVDPDKINHSTVALPGRYTTANLLFSFAYPGASRKKFITFSGIEEAVLNEETELGVIIHENRFTYQQKGLIKVVDLGEYWEHQMNIPIPLGGIAMKRSIPAETALQINGLIRSSLQYAFAHHPVLPPFVRKHSQAMSEEVMRQHIDLYVNDYSLDLGENGHKAIEALKSIHTRLMGPASSTSHLFL